MPSNLSPNISRNYDFKGIVIQQNFSQIFYFLFFDWWLIFLRKYSMWWYFTSWIEFIVKFFVSFFGIFLIASLINKGTLYCLQFAYLNAYFSHNDLLYSLLWKKWKNRISTRIREFKIIKFREDVWCRVNLGIDHWKYFF